jgi:hypothetical protein
MPRFAFSRLFFCASEQPEIYSPKVGQTSFCPLLFLLQSLHKSQRTHPSLLCMGLYLISNLVCILIEGNNSIENILISHALVRFCERASANKILQLRLPTRSNITATHKRNQASAYSARECIMMLGAIFSTLISESLALSLLEN